MALNLPPANVQAAPAKAKPPARFVVSACLTGFLFLSIGTVLIAAAINTLPGAFLPGVATAVAWTYYVLRPKTKTEMRLNALYLVLLAFALIGVAIAINAKEMELTLLYWALAIVSTSGAPVLVFGALLALHFWVCSTAANAQEQ